MRPSPEVRAAGWVGAVAAVLLGVGSFAVYGVPGLTVFLSVIVVVVLLLIVLESIASLLHEADKKRGL